MANQPYSLGGYNFDASGRLLVATTPSGGGSDTVVAIDQTTPGTTNGVVVNSSTLPTGAATSDNQATEITALQAIQTGVTSALPAGSAIIGKIGIDQTTPGTTNGIVLVSTAGVAVGVGTVATDSFSTATITEAVRSFNYSFNGSTFDRQRGDVNGNVNQSFAMASSRWQYAPPTGGIANSAAAVVVMAAAGAGVRNYMARLQISTSALATGSEIVVLDGATVIWRGYIGTVSGSQDHQFDVPLRGTANTSMSVQMVSASATGNVYCSAQGFQSAV